MRRKRALSKKEGHPISLSRATRTVSVTRGEVKRDRNRGRKGKHQKGDYRKGRDRTIPRSGPVHKIGRGVIKIAKRKEMWGGGGGGGGVPGDRWRRF